MKIKCRDCGLIKVRTRSLKPNSRGKYHYTEGVHGKRWNGRQCPDCKYNLSGGAFVREDEKAAIAVGPFDPNPLTSRKCVDCKKRLRKSSYFRCRECLNAMPEEQLDWGYGCNLYHRESVGFRISNMPILGAQ